MKEFFHKIYVKIGQFNMSVFNFFTGIDTLSYLYFFLTAFVSQSMMIVCPAFVAIIFPIFLVWWIESVYKRFMRLFGKTPKKVNVSGIICAALGIIVGILLSYAWIAEGPLLFEWF